MYFTKEMPHDRLEVALEHSSLAKKELWITGFWDLKSHWSLRVWPRSRGWPKIHEDIGSKSQFRVLFREFGLVVKSTGCFF